MTREYALRRKLAACPPLPWKNFEQKRKPDPEFPPITSGCLQDGYGDMIECEYEHDPIKKLRAVYTRKERMNTKKQNERLSDIVNSVPMLLDIVAQARKVVDSTVPHPAIERLKTLLEAFDKGDS